MAVAEIVDRKSAEASADDPQPAAFEILVHRHERLVLGVALRLLGVREDAQDVAQEVFLRLHRQMDRLDAGANLAAWLCRVTVNLCHDRWREVRRRHETDLEGVDRIGFEQSEVIPDAQGRTVRLSRLFFSTEFFIGFGKENSQPLRTNSNSLDVREGQSVLVGKSNLDQSGDVVVVVLTARVIN